MKKKFFLFFAAVLFAAAVCAADKLAIAEPVSKGGIPKQDIEAFWGILETSVRSEEYTLISRGALKQMLTEIGLTESSGLVNLNSAQKAKLGQLGTVKYILVSEIGKFGTRLNCTMRIIDASTGEIDQARTANLRVSNLDALADRIEATLEKLLSDDKQMKSSAILYPVIRLQKAPAYLAEDLNVHLENGLLSSGVKLQNLKSVARSLKSNNLDHLDELEPKMFVRVGQLLEVRMLIQAAVNRFEIVQIPFHVEETGARGFRYVGNIEGYIRIISARNGSVVASIPFAERVLFGTSNSPANRDSSFEDYGKFMIKTVVAGKILPELLKVSELKAR